MPRHKFEFDPPETDFLLYGICSQAKDYYLVWAINKKLNLHLKKEEDIVHADSSRFSKYNFENFNLHLKYILAAAKSKGKAFVKELKQMDYLFIIQGNYESLDADGILKKLKQSESVLAAYLLNPDTIKSNQYLF